MSFMEEMRKFAEENVEAQYREDFLALAEQVDIEEGTEFRAASPYSYLATRKWRGTNN